jgi:protein-S-isoprenylcysteine O-methyltransferase Ste14
LGIFLRIYTKKLLGEFFDLNIKVQKNHVIVKEGIYAYVRHPMYLANIMIFLGVAGFFSSIIGVISALVLVVSVTVMRIRREEFYLKKKFKRKYEAYVDETYALIPFVW